MLNRTLKAKIVEQFGCQADFSEVVGVDESVVSRIVRGRRQLSQPDQERWAAILRSDAGTLFNMKRRGEEPWIPSRSQSS